jgi:PAS domain S-box-containing protein
MASKPDNSSIDQTILREIVEGTATETGEEFFRTLVVHLAAALNTKCAWVTEWFADSCQLSALAMWVDDKHVDEYVYNIAGTPCEPVIDNRDLVHVPDRVIELYPEDPDLAPLGAVSYMGVPLLDTDGTILGHLAVLHNEPLPEDQKKVDIFNIFAGRAAAELRRLQRDRHIRDSEQRLSRLFNSAMDAIIELTSELAINRANEAAEKTFGCTQNAMASQSFATYLTGESQNILRRLMAELERQPEGNQSIWIPDCLEMIRADGIVFSAEATLSRCANDTDSIFAIILRNVSDRQEAEERIRHLTDEAEYLRHEIEVIQGFDDIIGQSDSLRRMLVDIDQVAGGDTTVLVTGETGTGKELVARAIHQRSDRSTRPLIKVNCAAIPAALQESEFFGHEKGAFTGATSRRDGRFKLAHSGTIFLDEVSELPPDLQAKLLRVLQEGEYEPVGASRTETVDVRVIAATNRDLDAMVDVGMFRRDLLYRLNVFPISVPPLRERENDVVLLAEAFAEGFAKRSGRPVPMITAGDRAKLRRYDWPGNVRELQNVVERAFITSRNDKLNLDRALPETASSSPEAGVFAGEDSILTVTELRDLERANIVRALDAASWKISGKGGAAELLGMNANTLSSRMKSLQIKPPQ